MHYVNKCPNKYSNTNVCVCVLVFLCLWGLKPKFPLTAWGLTTFVGT